MQNLVDKKVLVTTTNWFYGKDGRQYRAIHGTLKGIHEAGKTLGFIPNRAHANWFFEIGGMMIMGCQVMYIEGCDVVNTDVVTDWANNDNGCTQYERPTTIYVVD